MGTVHFLNVKPGDCTLIQHASGRVSMIDICCAESLIQTKVAFAKTLEQKAVRGNFGMCESSTNPLSYLNGNNIDSIFRFILTHPDMDHLDGFDALFQAIPVWNYWDSGVRREKPDFASSSYNEIDWRRYINVREGKQAGVTVVSPRAEARFPFANQEENKTGGDGLYILAPTQALVNAANNNGDLNDGSYVLLYRSGGGRVLMPGDAHDDTWRYVIDNHRADIEGCSVLIAPHHGRDSGRSFEFLDVIQPQLTLFGCAPSVHLAYDAWNRRSLQKLTSNQAGNVVMECNNGEIEVFIENDSFATKTAGYLPRTNTQGYYHYKTLTEDN